MHYTFRQLLAFINHLPDGSLDDKVIVQNDPARPIPGLPADVLVSGGVDSLGPPYLTITTP